VFDAIRSAMRSPLAQPPGRRGWLRRFAPELCALGVYLLMLTVFWWTRWRHPGFPMESGDTEWELRALGQAALVGAVWAYALAGLIFLIGPTVSGALAWGRERDRETLEALVLTPAAPEALVRGRFWRVALPWMRFCVYLLPVYLLLSTNNLFAEACTEKTWAVSDICALGSHLFFGLCGEVWDWLLGGPHRPNPWTVGLAAVRLANDVTIPLFACALAYFLSLKSRTSGRAMLWSGLLVPGALLVALDLHNWLFLLVVWRILPLNAEGWQYVLVCSTYLALGLAAFIARIWLALWLVKHAARNFDWYALGEKPPPS
jgi:hypothetical protein